MRSLANRQEEIQMSINWCKFFADIEADPTKIVKGLTVRQMIQAKLHINECQDCMDRADRVLANKPKDTVRDLFKEN